MQRNAFIRFISLVCLLYVVQANALQDKSAPAPSNTSAETTLKAFAEQVESYARSKPARAIEISEQALKETNPLFDSHSYGRLLNGTSYALYFLNRYEEAMRKAKLAERIALRHGLNDILARSQMLQANVLKRIGEYTRAINQYTEAANYYETTGDSLFHSYVLNNIANTYLTANLVPSAIDYFKKSLSINEQSSAYKGMADALARQEKYELALQTYEKALELYRADGDSFGVVIVRNGQGSAYNNLQQTDKAIELFSEALRLAETYQQSFTIGYSNQGIARALFLQENYEEALVWLEKSTNIAFETDDKIAIVRNTELKAKIYEGQLRFEDALKAMQELRVKEQEFKTEQDLTQLVVMQALFESDAKTSEIAELEEKNKLLQLENEIEHKNSQTARFTSIVLIIALLSFSFWIYYVNREKSRLAKVSAELEKARATAEHATKTKSAFLANMSHEIRTPLTSIIGYADSILQGDIPEREEQRVIKIISENGNHLLNVISDILDFTKIEANKLEFEILTTPLFPLFSQIESVTGKRAHDKGLSFEVLFHYPLPESIETDPTRLRQILFNLTNNALKFTMKGSISMSVKAVSENLVIAVRDTGIGISKQNQKGLFTPFQQADGSINRRFGGSGLGLSISQHLAQGLGGQIDFFSEEGKGSEFILTIALKEASGCRWVDCLEELTFDSRLKQSIQDVPEYGKAKVLLAEDHPNNRELITMMLRRLDLDVTSVENGQQACEVAAKSDFKLIFLDIQMPVMDGIRALKEIKKTGNKVPIIALTANNMKHEVEQYMQEGFSDHLPKPLPRDALVEKLDKFLQRSELVAIESKEDSENLPETNSDQMDISKIEVPLFSPPKDQMIKLLRNYIEHLQEDIEEALFCWQKQDWSRLLEIAHSIKGSAGGFGLGTIGEMFSALEQQINQANHQAALSTLDKALGELNYYTQMPEVDIAAGIHNHQQNLEQWYQDLANLIASIPNQLTLLSNTTDSNTKEKVAILNELEEKMVKTGMISGAQLCHKIIDCIDKDKDLANKQIAQLHAQLSELKDYLR